MKARGSADPWLEGAFEATMGGQDAQAALTRAQGRAEQGISCAEAAGGSVDGETIEACARQIDPAYP